MGVDIEGAVQFVHGDGFGVQDLLLDVLVDGVGGVLVLGLVPLIEVDVGGPQHVDALTFAAQRCTHQHDSEAHLQGFVELHHLLHEVGCGLQVQLLDFVADHILQLTVLHDGQHEAREQVLHDGVEERNVVGEELGDVGLTHGSDQDDVFVQCRLLTLQGARHDQQRLDGSHAEIVVILLTQLLGAQLVQLGHLATEVLGVAEALREEHDLRDEAVVGHHHRHRSEQHLQVVG